MNRVPVDETRNLSKCKSHPSIRTFIAFVLLFFLILPVYSNIFHASWQFDDSPNIVNNSRLHINNLMPGTLWNTFFAKPNLDRNLYRPLPCMTFALNWYFGKDNPTGYHVANILIHILSAFFLYICILALFKTPNLRDKYDRGDACFIALLSAALWAVNPIQTQAVTYIVQRMASMAAMFYILGIYFFIKGRLSSEKHNRILFYAACLLAFLCALCSKENAIMLPLSLLLVEIVFLGKWSNPESGRKITKTAWIYAILVLFAGAIIFLKVNPLSFLQGYENRPFSFLERLITEPKIVLHYLTQIFYPAPHRLSIEHDVVISTSLLKPWTTLPAILIVLSLIGIGISEIWKRPLISFGILFFFLNHIIESTVIPLELVFEHRNYLPSFFLFVPFAAGIKRLLNYYVDKKYMYLTVVTFVTLLLLALGLGTYTRNMAWTTKNTLWLDAMNKAPGMARPLTNLAAILAEGNHQTPGRYELALELYEKALSLKISKNISLPCILGNMAGIHFKKNDYPKAVELYKKALNIDPGYIKGRYDMAVVLTLMGNFKEASENVDYILSKGLIHEDYLNLKGYLLLWQEKPEEALPYFRKALSMVPRDSGTLLNTGAAYSHMGRHKNAELFLKHAARNSSCDMIIYFCLIENSLRAGDESSAGKYTEKLLASFSLKSIQNELERLPGNHRSVPVSRELIAPMIKKKLTEACKAFEIFR